MVRKPLSASGTWAASTEKSTQLSGGILAQPRRQRIAGKLIGQNYRERRVLRQRGTPPGAQPRAAATRAKVDYALGAAVTNGAEDLLLDRPIDICAADNGLETIGGSVAHRLWTPRLIQNFKELKTPQTSIADLSTKPSPPAAPPHWR